MDWGKNRETLVLALSTRCHFCTESAAFFRRLSQETGGRVKVVAVLPEAVSESEQYLEDEGLHPDAVRQASMSSIGVVGTPTILLVNDSGMVARVWTGKVQAEDEDSAVRLLRETARARLTPGAKEGRKWLEWSEGVFV